MNIGKGSASDLLGDNIHLCAVVSNCIVQVPTPTKDLLFKLDFLALLTLFEVYDRIPPLLLVRNLFPILS